MAGQRPPRSRTAVPVDSFSYLTTPAGGWDADTSPMMMGSAYAPQLDNFIPRNAMLSMRSGFTCVGDVARWALTNPSALRALTVFNINGGATSPVGFSRFASASAGLAPCLCPTFRPNNSTLVGQSDGNEYFTSANMAGGAPTATATTHPVGSRGTSFAEMTYGVSFPSTTVAPLSVPGGYYVAATYLLGKTATVNTVYTNGPLGATHCKIYQSRLWSINGCDPGTTTNFSTNILHYTNPIVPGTPVPNLVSSWQDPTTSTMNKIPIGDDNNALVGIGVTNSVMILFAQRGIYLLRGTTPSNYSVQVLSREIGCIDPRSIVETDHGIYFLSHRGLMLTTGSAVTNVSGRVRNALASVCSSFPTLTAPCASAAQLSDGSIVVSITTENSTTKQLVTVWSGVYNPTYNVWYRFTSALWGLQETDSNVLTVGLPGNIFGNSFNGGVYAASQTRFVQFEPPGSTIDGLGLAARSFVDVYLNSSSIPVNASSYTIPAIWKSCFVPLSGAGRYNTSGVRWWLDYVGEIFDPGSSGAPAWPAATFTGNLQDPASVVLVGSQMTPAFLHHFGYVVDSTHTIVPPNPNFMHTNQDFAASMTHAQISVSQAAVSGWPLTNFPNPVGRFLIYGAGVEFQQNGNLR